MKIATYNVNGIRSRLPNLLEWLEREAPDVVCLQELKAVDQGFPIGAIHDAGYGALWAGQASWNGVAILAKGVDPVESRRGLPGDAKDTQSRYLEAMAHGVLIGCIYLPNGNPWPGPKFDYKLAWFERFLRHAKGLLDTGQPVVLAGDYNVVPTDEDIYDAKHWRRDALLQPESRDAYARLLAQGWTDALRERHPDERIYTFWDYFRQHWPRDRGLRIDHLLLAPVLAARLKDANVDRWVRDRPKASDHAPVWVELDAPAGRRGPVKEAAVKKAAGKKATAKKTAGKKAAAKKVAGKKATAKKAAGKMAPAKTATKAPSGRPATKKVAAQAPPRRPRGPT